MAELVMALIRTKTDIVKALRMKSMLGNKGVEVSGLVIREKGEGAIPLGFLEDMVQLRVMGFLS